ncbi:hypothetical protein WR25_21788 [Diploscapter pachys]|uniref:Uncharacterized protein n=1 Tax=Diploscapter pachys TaxID=2018661 RepID=A0A2A2M2I5_9BILA|nr:hypothetical protein WR25_21788 [Diploscapter pachys]
MRQAARYPRRAARRQQAQQPRRVDTHAALAGEQHLASDMPVVAGIMVAQGRADADHRCWVGVRVKGAIGCEPCHCSLSCFIDFLA